MAKQLQHFLVITIGAQGHINPARHLAGRLIETGGARVTLTIPILAYRRMFPSAAELEPQEERDGLLTYIPYSDGIEDGLDSAANPVEFKRRIAESLKGIAAGFVARGRPISCIVYALLLSVAAEVARGLGVPSVLLWIQSATTFAINYHYFAGHDKLSFSAHEAAADPSFLVELPGLPAFRMKDLPTLLTGSRPEGTFYSFLYALYGEVFEALRGEVSAGGAKPRVILNTFRALEEDVISGFEAIIDMVTVGPLVPPSLTISAEERKQTFTTTATNDLYEHDTSDYMEWLDGKEEGTVVYVCFGSYAALKEGQAEEITKGLAASGRPYIWAMAKGGKEDDDDRGLGMKVEWCEQARVMSHRAVGCFVTHCGWNSVGEAVACGVPMVTLPQWTDQVTNAKLVEEEWGVGVRAEVDWAGGGVMAGEELRRCLEVVMGGDEGAGMRRKAKAWSEKAREAVGEGGSSARNLAAFVGGNFMLE